MTNLAQWSALVGFLLPLLIAIVQQSHWSRRTRTVVGAIAVTVAALVTAATENKLNWDTWATSLIWIAVTAYTSYRNVWIPLGAAPAIEEKTTLNKP